MKNIKPINNTLEASEINTANLQKNFKSLDVNIKNNQFKKDHLDKVDESIRVWKIESIIINIYAWIAIAMAVLYSLIGTFLNPKESFTSFDYFVNVITVILFVMLFKRVSFTRILLLVVSWVLLIMIIFAFVYSGYNLSNVGILTYLEFAGLMFSIIFFSSPAIKRHF